jgi:hypothetical protein
MLREPIQRAPQAVVVERIGADPVCQYVLDRFVLAIVRYQRALSSTEPKPMEDHGSRRRSSAHTSCLYLTPFGSSCFSTDSCHSPYMVQAFCLVRSFL